MQQEGKALIILLVAIAKRLEDILYKKESNERYCHGMRAAGAGH